MTRIIEKPAHECVRKWGPLAHVDDEERARILALPAGQLDWELKRITKELKDLKKRRKR